MKSIWITNFSNKAISINDLGIRLQPNQSMDIRQSKSLTQDQITKSLLSGDLKVTKLYVSENPLNIKTPQLTLFKKVYPKESVSAINIETKRFAELEELMSSQGFDNLSDQDKEAMEQKLMAQKEDELISQMLGEEK